MKNLEAITKEVVYCCKDHERIRGVRQRTKGTIMTPGFPNNMTTREYFAGLAMQGLLGQHTDVEYESGHSIEPLFQGDDPLMCKRAVEIADMLIAQLRLPHDH